MKLEVKESSKLDKYTEKRGLETWTKVRASTAGDPDTGEPKMSVIIQSTDAKRVSEFFGGKLPEAGDGVDINGV